MIRTLPLLALLLATLLSVPAAAALDAAADEAIAPLKQSFDNLYRSLQNEGGMNDNDKPAMRHLRERFTAFNEAHPGNERGLAYELQLAIWLQEDDRVERLFGALVELAEDNKAVAMAWAEYFMGRNDYTRADRAYGRLLEQYPDDPEIRLEYARELKERNLYTRAASILQRYEFDYAETPGAAALLSDCLFADHHFEEAIAVLESIPPVEELPADEQFVKNNAESTLDEMRAYAEFWKTEQEIRATEAEANTLPRAQIITPKGVIQLELFENQAPNTVANFISLAEEKFYHGSTFHRVLPNFMAQGGDPNTKPGGTGEPGTGNPGYYIADEHTRADARKHFAGSLAMAKQPVPNTAGCQFFLTVTPTPWLNGQHTVFGRVTEGLSVARQLEPGDRIEAVMILRKRDHEYVPEKLPLSSGPQTVQPGQQVIDSISNPAPPSPQPDAGTSPPPPGGGND